MGIRLPEMMRAAKQVLKLNKYQSDVPKGHVAVDVGELQKKRFVVPISYLNHPSVVDLDEQRKNLGSIMQWMA